MSNIHSLSPPLSGAAVTAFEAGSQAMCPGCRFERKIPENAHGAALHTMPGSGSRYECHASEAWENVPEFTDKSS